MHFLPAPSTCCVSAWKFVTAHGKHNTELFRLGGAEKECPDWRSTAVLIPEQIAGRHTSCSSRLSSSLYNPVCFVLKDKCGKGRRVLLSVVVGCGWCTRGGRGDRGGWGGSTHHIKGRWESAWGGTNFGRRGEPEAAAFCHKFISSSRTWSALLSGAHSKEKCHEWISLFTQITRLFPFNEISFLNHFTSKPVLNLMAAAVP